MEEVEETFALLRQNIKKFRAKRSLTQAQLSEMVDISHDYLRQVEAGIRNPSLKTVIKIAVALKVDVYQLFQKENYR